MEKSQKRLAAIVLGIMGIVGTLYAVRDAGTAGRPQQIETEITAMETE